MSRSFAVSVTAAAVWAFPSLACAQDGAHTSVSWVVGALTLLAAAGLLAIALALSRIARGSALADHVSYIVASCVTLGASVLAQWTGRFVDDPFALAQVQLGSQLLVTATVVFLCIYFYRVQAALKRFLRSATAADDGAMALTGSDAAAPSLAMEAVGGGADA